MTWSRQIEKASLQKDGKQCVARNGGKFPRIIRVLATTAPVSSVLSCIETRMGRFGTGKKTLCIGRSSTNVNIFQMFLFSSCAFFVFSKLNTFLFHQNQINRYSYDFFKDINVCAFFYFCLVL